MESIEFLRTAEALLQNESVAEVECRNAASRAYYCAYHSCLDLSKRYPSTNDVKTKGGVHQRLINTLCSHQDERVKSAGYFFNQIKRLRVKADYKLTTNFTLQDSQFAVNSVQKLLQEINEIQSTSMDSI
ncbi:MAG: HEPN domain-containing protein [Thiotrichaceae bacterium]